MFFDNLETPWGAEQKALAALNGGGGSGGFGGLPSALSGPGTPSGLRSPIGLYHNRNRTYLPSLGRFAQRDPNASGQVVQARMLFGGAGCATCPSPSADAVRMYADGLSLHQYVGSDPVGQGDPRGLFLGIGAFVVAETIDGYSTAEDMLGTLYAGYGTFFGLRDMLDDHAQMQMGDVDWALDWSQPDWAGAVLGVSPEAYGYQLDTCGEEESGSGSAGPAMANMANSYRRKWGPGVAEPRNIPGAFRPSINWGRNRTMKELRKAGFKYTGRTDTGGGSSFTNPSTGQIVRVMPQAKGHPSKNADPGKWCSREGYWREQWPNEGESPHYPLAEP